MKARDARAEVGGGGRDGTRAGAAGLLAGLNPAQREAVTHASGPLLILAGPGSGKTRVITRRVACLALERGVDPRRILAITFTNKAAREMQARVENLLQVRGPWIGTFHAFCARLLRREIEALGQGFTRDFTIYDTSDRNQLLKALIKQGGWDTTRFRPALVGGWISSGKNRGCGDDGGAATAAEEEQLAQQGIEHEVLVRLRKAYAEALQRHNALDFDDLLLKALEVFEVHPGIRDAWAQRFLHVMVDEYQDTNRAQYLLTRHLAGGHGNLAVCGDPDQSIYAWRGADLRNILEFERDHPGARTVRLEQNYRSTNTILKAAQALIANNRARKAKDLWSELGAGRRLTVMHCADEEDEGREIARQIQALAAEGLRPGRMAVFYRVNFMQRALESALRLARVPYQVVGGQEFYERREIRDLLAWAKLAVNPADDVAFRRVVNVPLRGIGERSLAALAGFAADRRLPLSAALRSSEALAQVRGRARAGLEAFGELLTRLEPLRDEPAGLALERIVAEIDYEAWLAEMADEQMIDRASNVNELLAHADRYDAQVALVVQAREAAAAQLQADKRAGAAADTATGSGADEAAGADAADLGAPAGGLRGFLQEVALISDVDALEDSTDKVSLMTLHSAKGLEFQAVFIAGCEEDLLPHSRALEGGGAADGLEEERRLLYVGLTRAEQRLVLTHAAQRMFFGQSGLRAPSRFLDELPPELIEGHEPERDEREMLGDYAAPSAAEALAVGDRVEHEHFGRGTVERLQGSGVNARATVHFAAHGTKHLLLQYAHLRKVAGGRR